MGKSYLNINMKKILSFLVRKFVFLSIASVAVILPILQKEHNKNQFIQKGLDSFSTGTAHADIPAAPTSEVPPITDAGCGCDSDGSCADC